MIKKALFTNHFLTNLGFEPESNFWDFIQQQYVSGPPVVVSKNTAKEMYHLEKYLKMWCVIFVRYIYFSKKAISLIFYLVAWFFEVVSVRDRIDSLWSFHTLHHSTATKPEKEHQLTNKSNSSQQQHGFFLKIEMSLLNLTRATFFAARA